MHLSDNGLKFISSFEGYHEALPDGRCRAYRCVVGHKNGKPVHDGKWSIGWGCTEGVTEGLIWTREEAEQAFREELSHFEAAVNRLVKVPISQNAYDACVSFAYNCGEGALAKSGLLKKLNKGDMQGAAREFGKWVNSNGVKNVPGLVRRRAEEAAMFLRPDAVLQSKNVGQPAPSMPQTVEAPAPVAAAVQSSRTVFGILTAFGAALVSLFKDAVEQITLLEPVKQIGSGLGLNATTIIFAITVAGLALALFAKMDDTARGKVVLK